MFVIVKLYYEKVRALLSPLPKLAFQKLCVLGFNEWLFFGGAYVDRCFYPHLYFTISSSIFEVV